MKTNYEEPKDVFFSHSSRDEKVLSRLKTKLLEKFGEPSEDMLKIFLSSDGKSIPFGKNWVYELEKALDGAKLMFVFLSPNSIDSHWLSFEAGIAYKNGIDVVPVGIIGVDLFELGMPFGLLQGFNVQDKDGLNNIVSKIKKVFCDLECSNMFTEKEFDNVFIDVYGRGRSIFGKYYSRINRITYKFRSMFQIGENFFDFNANKAGHYSKNYELCSKPIENTNATKKQRWLFKGWDFVRYLNDDDEEVLYNSSIDPLAYPTAIKFLQSSYKVVSDQVENYELDNEMGIRIQFDGVFNSYLDDIQVSAMMLGTDLYIDEKGKFSYKDKVKFNFPQDNPLVNSSVMDISHSYAALDDFNIGAFITLLFDQNIIIESRTIT
jgi:hypothetical protein